MIRLILVLLIATGSIACTAQEKKYTNISTSEFAEAIKAKPEAIILDVRTPNEFNSGHLKDAINIDFYQNFEKAIEELDREKEYLVYCRSGGRSEKAAVLMAQKGFKNVSNMLGGILSWQGEKVK